MFVDETLAKSLAKNSIVKLDSDLLEVEKIFNLKLSKIDTSKRSNFEKILKLHKEAFANKCFCYVRCGSKRNPYICYIPTFKFTEREYKKWNEDALLGMPIFKYLPNWESVFKYDFPIIRVGQHALTRVLQRSGLVTSLQEINNNLIFSEFKYLSLWSAFWSKFFYESKCIDDFNCSEMSIVVPAPHGILLCEIHKDEEIQSFYNLEVRTYINTNQLSDSQYQFRLQILEASRELENTPLSFFPYIMQLHNHEDSLAEIIFLLLLFRIKKFTDSISFTIFKNDFDAYKFQQTLESFIFTKLGNLADHFEVLDKEINCLGYEEYSLHPGNKLHLPDVINHIQTLINQE